MGSGPDQQLFDLLDFSTKERSCSRKPHGLRSTKNESWAELSFSFAWISSHTRQHRGVHEILAVPYQQTPQRLGLSILFKRVRLVKVSTTIEISRAIRNVEYPYFLTEVINQPEFFLT